MILGTQRSRNNSFCKLNLRMDGANDGTSFIDSSATNKSISANNVVTKTTEKRYGSASAYNNSNSGFLRISDTIDFSLSSYDSTTRVGALELWYKTTNNTTTDLFQNLFGSYYADPALYTKYIGYANFNWSGQAGTGIIGCRFRDGVAPNEDTYYYLNSRDTNWHHYLFAFNGSVVDVYQDGIKLSVYSTGSKGYTKFPRSQSSNGVNVNVFQFGSGATSTAYGYIDDLRWYKGSCLKTRNFKPPNRAA